MEAGAEGTGGEGEGRASFARLKKQSRECVRKANGGSRQNVCPGEVLPARGRGPRSPPPRPRRSSPAPLATGWAGPGQGRPRAAPGAPPLGGRCR